MFNDILNGSQSKHKKIYYGLTEEEVKDKLIGYNVRSSKYVGKGVNTSLKGLIQFLIDNNMQKYIKYYTIIDIDKFVTNTDIYPDKKYDMITVRTPIVIKIDNYKEIDYSKYDK